MGKCMVQRHVFDCAALLLATCEYDNRQRAQHGWQACSCLLPAAEICCFLPCLHRNFPAICKRPAKSLISLQQSLSITYKGKKKIYNQDFASGVKELLYTALGLLLYFLPAPSTNWMCPSLAWQLSVGLGQRQWDKISFSPEFTLGCFSISLGCKFQIHLRDLEAQFPFIFNGKGPPTSFRQL